MKKMNLVEASTLGLKEILDMKKFVLGINIIDTPKGEWYVLHSIRLNGVPILHFSIDSHKKNLRKIKLEELKTFLKNHGFLFKNGNDLVSIRFSIFSAISNNLKDYISVNQTIFAQYPFDANDMDKVISVRDIEKETTIIKKFFLL